MTPQFIEELVDACKPNAGGDSPHGWTYRPASESAELAELAHNKFFQVGTPTPHGIPVRPLDQAVNWLAEANATPHHTPKKPVAPAILPVAGNPATAAPAGNVTFDDNIPPPSVARGRGRPVDGPTLIEKWGFDKLVVNQSFYVGQEHSPKPDVPVHRAFSSVVSNARKKLWPMNFVIAAVDETAMGRGVGARVWRVADLQGERPVPKERAKRKNVEPAAPTSPPQPPAPTQGFAPPAGGGFVPPGMFTPPPAQGGFSPAPVDPSGMSGGFSPPVDRNDPSGPAAPTGGDFTPPSFLAR